MTEQRKLTCDICGAQETFEVSKTEELPGILRHLLNGGEAPDKRTFMECQDMDMCPTCHNAFHEYADTLLTEVSDKATAWVEARQKELNPQDQRDGNVVRSVRFRAETALHGEEN